MNQGNESGAIVLIIDHDGETLHNVKRTVRDIKNSGYKKTGRAKIKGKTYNVTAEEWRWIGTAQDYN